MAKQSPAQRRASLRNLAKARRARGGRKRRASRAGRHRSSRRYRAVPTRDGPKLGAAYEYGKLGLQIASPITDDALSIVNGASAESAMANLKTQASTPGYRNNYAKGVLSGIAQAYVDKKLRIANALSRKSVTALLPEVYAVGSALYDNDLDPKNSHAAFIQTTSGFDPQASSFAIKGTKASTYLIGKYGGALIRKAAKAVPAIGKPIKEGLGMFGVTL